ncbi:MAG TPA: fatty-acid--CoA ligase FadD8 [Marmoricola sp.]|nr:fatty-acid--CoA ligase FadD8 [Marmoricola sp.]
MTPPEELRTGVHNGHLMVAALKRHRDRPVMHLGDTTLTGGQVAERISQYVQAFEALGAGRDAPGALLALNRPEVLFILGAGQTQGYRRTSLQPLGSLDDHAWVIDDAGIHTLVIDPVPMFVERAVALLERCAGLQQVLTIGPVPEVLDAAARGRGRRCQDLAGTAAAFEPQPLEAALLPPDHIVSITYTGGTTGKPKGVIGTAQQMNTMSQIQLAEWEWPDAPRFLMCTPLSHAGAAFFVPTVIKGGTLFVLPKFDPAEVLRTIEEQQITATMLVPSMLYALLDHPDSHTRDLSSLETVYYGASAINPVRLREAIDRFGPVFAQYYGQSEAPMAIAYFPKADHLTAVEEVAQRSSRDCIPERLSSCGRPSAFLRTALLGEDGQPVEEGEPGEICVAGPLVAGGYWNRPEETAETFRDGWMHTGDVARQDADGFWYIVDRTKDMIVTGGFNVFPREVEDVVAEHPAVAQVGVIGVPDDKWGEAVTAVVVLRDGHELSDEVVAEIQGMVRDRKGSVQAPKQVIATDALPLTGLGKPDKKALRARFWEGSARAVG